MNQISFEYPLMECEDDLWAKLKELRLLGWEGNLSFKPVAPGMPALWQLSADPGSAVQGGVPFLARIGQYVVKVGNLYDAMSAEEILTRYGVEVDNA